MADDQATTAPKPEALDFVPVRRDDVERVAFESESVAWSPIRQMPVYLDPVANVLYEVIDGEASVADLVDDVVAEVGIDRETATAQVTRVTGLLHGGGLLASSPELPGQELLTDWFGTAHDN